MKALGVVCLTIALDIRNKPTPQQELGQADISVVRKAELKERLGVVRKAFDKQIKEKEAAANKEVCRLLS